MNQLNQDVARAIVAARLASAREHQLASEAKRARRLDRPGRSTRSARSWLRHHLFRWPVRPPAPVPAPTPRPHGVVGSQRSTPRPLLEVELRAILDRTAEQIVEHGTRSARSTLEAMSEAVRHVNPGAAAALIDGEGSEVARLRAFGLVHGLVVDELDTCAQWSLLNRINGSGPMLGLALTG